MEQHGMHPNQKRIVSIIPDAAMGKLMPCVRQEEIQLEQVPKHTKLLHPPLEIGPFPCFPLEDSERSMQRYPQLEFPSSAELLEDTINRKINR
jgi:hypothetical protein